MGFKSVFGDELYETGNHPIVYKRPYIHGQHLIIEFYVSGDAKLEENEELYRHFAEVFSAKALGLDHIDFSKRPIAINKNRETAVYQCSTLYSGISGKSSELFEIEIKRRKQDSAINFIKKIYADIIKNESSSESTIGDYSSEFDAAIARGNVKQCDMKKQVKEEVKEESVVVAEEKGVIRISELTEEQIVFLEKLVDENSIDTYNYTHTELLAELEKRMKEEPKAVNDDKVDIMKLTDEEAMKLDELLMNGDIDINNMTMTELRNILASN